MVFFRFVAMAIAKSFSKIFGIATITFFGRQPSRDDDKVAAAGLGSIVWLTAVVMAAFPVTAEVIAPPIADNETLVRWIGVALGILLPPVIGVVIYHLHNRDRGPGLLAHMGLGFGFAIVISVLVIALVLVVPAVKASYILRRFELEHIAIMVEEGRFEDVCGAVMDILERNEIEARYERPNPAIRWVFAGLTWVEGRIFRRGLSTDMAVIRGEVAELGWFEITIHSTDLTIIGKQAVSTRLLALLSEELDVRSVYFSWDDESQAIEDEVRDCRRQLDDGEPCDDERLAELTERLRGLELSREEWNALRRQLYLVERDSARLRERLASRTETA
jgi:hypothetical protein